MKRSGGVAAFLSPCWGDILSDRRRKGFAIHARSAKGGVLYTEAKVLEVAGVTVVRERRTHAG
jgi:hypothetical protein